MSVAVGEEPQILHAIPGRIRVHVPGWAGQGKRLLETQLRHLQGVLRVQANQLTGNILILFDSSVTSEQAILREVHALDMEQVNAQEREPAPAPTIHEKQGRTVRARIAVRGMDRDPHLAKRVVEHVQRHYPGVQVKASHLTGRVLVEFTEHEAELDDLIAEITRMELPDQPGEDRPAYPLDPGPLIQSASRSVGSALGLGLLAGRQLLGIQEALPGAGAAIQISSIIGILQGIPPVRYGLRRLLGRTIADLLFNVPGIVTLTLASSLLGLALTGGESLRLLTEVIARRSAWRRHEERIAHAPSSQPDAIINLEAGERAPLAAEVLGGTGTAIGRDGMPQPVVPGGRVPPGARLYGGPFTLRLRSEDTFQAFIPQPRPAPIAPSLYGRYMRIQAPFSLLYAAATALLTRSFSRTLAALLLVNPRPAAIGIDSAELGASARIIRAGVTVVGTRTHRSMRLPSHLLLDGARLLTDQLELSGTLPQTQDNDPVELLALAAGVASAAGSPWGGIFRGTATAAPATDGGFDGKTATAFAEGVRYTLGPVEDYGSLPEAARLRQQGNYVLALQSECRDQPLALFSLRPRLAAGIEDLMRTCQRYGVELAVLSTGDQLAVRALARRAQVAVIEHDDAVHAIRARQRKGGFVAFVSDNAGASAGFDACDLAIGFTDDRSHLPARADLLAPDFTAVAAIIEAAARREATMRDAIGLSALSNIVGAVWGFQGAPGLEVASRTVYISSLISLLTGWLRLRGGARSSTTLSRLVDPRPERWGRRSVEETLHLLHTSEQGLTNAQAAARRQSIPQQVRRNRLVAALLEQISSPLIGILAAGAGISLLFGAVGDVVIIGATILGSVAMGVWQEQRANQVAESLRQIGTASARVLRDGQISMIPSSEVVPGDVLVLASGDRIAADARVVNSYGLEVDESSLTGESLPVPKVPTGGGDASHIVLEGTDVTSGTGHAVVVAIGQQTRMGATRAALSADETQQSPLGVRLSRMLNVFLPLTLAGGVTVVASGLLWGQPLAALLATGATIALAGVPEGLPLLARVGEAGVAHRLAERFAVVRRLSAVETLGRVDVACADKTGTMTRGRLELSLVADMEQEAQVAEKLSPELQHVLLTAALASPHPDAPDVKAHPTDVAVIHGAELLGLGDRLRVKHEAEVAFDPVRSFHATVAVGHLCVKGAPEALLPRCRWLVCNGETELLDEANRDRLVQRAQRLAVRGLRVLMVAQGPSDTAPDDPQGLTALGFVGISDPLRATVRAAVRKCHDAGVRVIMITGDHPSTARAIAREAGLLNGGGEVLTAAEIAELQNGELDARVARAAVIARATPLEKLRIIESLQRQGHAVAMTGDGVNDAPALRLADVGVAMGKTGTEVARQTADVVITDDDFSTLVEAFVEGRSFWRNIRRALGLLLGGNLGELGLVAGASILGGSMPLTARQILAVNAITDILPALAVALQQPEHRNLAALSREGTSTLGKPLRNEIVFRGAATTLPALASYLVMLGAGGLPQARAVAFASIVVTQLAQTLDAGRAEGSLTRSVVGAVAGSAGVLLAAFAIPPLRSFLNLVMPSPLGWLLIGSGGIAAVLLHHLFDMLENTEQPAAAPRALPAPQLVQA